MDKQARRTFGGVGRVNSLDLNVVATIGMVAVAVLVLVRNAVDFYPEAKFGETIGLLHVATIVSGVLAIYSLKHPERCTENEFRFLTWFYLGACLCMVVMAFVHAKHHKLGELVCTVFTALIMATLSANNTSHTSNLTAGAHATFKTVNQVFLGLDAAAFLVVLVVAFFMVYDLAISNRRRHIRSAPRHKAKA